MQGNRFERRKPTGRLSTDLVLIVENLSFHVQREVLFYYSPVLKDRLENNKSKSIKLFNVQPEILKILLEYMYTGYLRMNCQNIAEIYKTAQKLRMKDVVVKIIQNLQKNDASALIFKYSIAEQLRKDKEKIMYFEIILKNLERCINSTEFLNLSVGQLCDILVGAGVNNELTNLKSNLLLYLAALKWIGHNRAVRIQHAVTVMCCVPFWLMSKDELLRCFYPPVSYYVVQVPGVKKILYSVMNLNAKKKSK